MLKKFLNRVQYYLTTTDATPPTSRQAAKDAWKNVLGSQKRDYKNEIIGEHNGLCGYTELKLEGESYGSHIEHIKPRSRYPHLTFNCKNLIINALTGEDEQYYARNDLFGGCYKGDNYDESLFLSCIEVDGNEYFNYLINGEVEPKSSLTSIDRGKAWYTITTLNLNSPVLVQKRRNHIDSVSSDIDELLDDPCSLERYKRQVTEPNARTGYYDFPFISATLSLFQ